MATVKGGDKLGKALARIAANLSKPGTLGVGFLENATYPNGTPVAMIAALNNYGTRNMPPRPFFSNMVAEKSGGWPAALATNLKANDYDTEKALVLMGEGIAGQLRKSIVDFSGAPLAPSTIRRKGHAKQLVDSGVMLGSVDYDILG